MKKRILAISEAVVGCGAEKFVLDQMKYFDESSFGLPIIASDISTTASIIDNNTNGILYNMKISKQLLWQFVN